MGVKRALDTVLEARRKYNGVIYTHGPLIHNPQVLNVLRQIEIQPLNEDAKGGGPVVIRAHGITPEERKEIKATGSPIVDATCPRVAMVHGLARKAFRSGRMVIIFGDQDHAEVKGILGACKGNAIVVENEKDIENITGIEQAEVLSQTTFSKNKFQEFLPLLQSRIPDLIVHDTICDATRVRQEEARRLARISDAVIVVGGKNSANTRRLAQIVEEEGTRAFHVETEEDLPQEVFTLKNIGITAGASTPYWLFHRVAERVWERRLHGLLRWVWALTGFFIRSYLLIAAGAFCLTLAGEKLLGHHVPMFPIIAALYFFCMHVVNGYSERQATEINEPAQQLFLRRHRVWLLPFSFAAGVTLIVMAGYISHSMLLIISLATILGVLYEVPVPYLKFRLKAIPASKDFFTSGAWSVVTIVLPAWQAGNLSVLTWAIAGIIFLLLFVRALLYDVKDLQGDRIVGRETIPVALGRRMSQILSVAMTMIAVVFILLLPISFMYLLLLPFHALLCLLLYHRRWIVSGIRFNLAVDGIYPLFLLVLTLTGQ